MNQLHLRDMVPDLFRKAADHHATMIDLAEKRIHAAVEEARP